MYNKGYVSDTFGWEILRFFLVWNAKKCLLPFSSSMIRGVTKKMSNINRQSTHTKKTLKYLEETMDVDNILKEKNGFH